MVTLEQAMVGKATKVDQKIIDTFRRNSELLARMEFDDSVTRGQGSTLSYGYIQVKTPSPAGRRDLNTEYVAGEATKEEKRINLDIFGGSYEVDRVLDEAQPEEVAFQAEEKIKSTVNVFHNQVINGNIKDGDKFDGLKVLLAGSDTEFESEVDLSVVDEDDFKAESRKICEEIDAVLGSMLDKPDYILANTKTLIKLQSAARVMGYLTHAENAFGKQVMAYNDIPFLDMKDYVRIVNGVTLQTPIIPVDYGTGKSDVYFVKLSRDALCGVTISGNKIVTSRLPDFTQAQAVSKGDVEFVAGIALKNSRKAGVLRDIKVGTANMTYTLGSVSSGTFTPGDTQYALNVLQENKINVTGTIPYVANPELGVDAGNVLCFKLANSAITNKNQLPEGKIVKVIGKVHTTEATSAAFEDDGSLVFYGSVFADTPTVIEIYWKTGIKTVYTIDCSKATLPTA